MASTEPWRNPPPAPDLAEVRYRLSPRSVLITLLRAWWPALVWAIMIFFLSTDAFSSEHTSRIIEPLLRWLYPAISSDTLYWIHHLIRKGAHFVEYFIFGLLLYRGVRVMQGARTGWRWSWALTAWMIAIVYSALDEIHQIFVPSRGPSLWDSMLDSAAALAALLLLFLLYRRLLRPRSA